MTDAASKTLSIVIERELPHPPERIWRALTQPHLIEAWLMKNEFKPELGHAFTLKADWGTVECSVRAVEENRRLSYSWDAKPLESIVTWTLTPTSTGTRLRMEQAGFGPENEMAFRGATAGWPRYFGALEDVLARLD